KDNTSPAGTRSMQFLGSICPTQGKGRGYFILPQLPNSGTAPLMSGALEWISSEQ
ncbi:MAG: hypothetical protein JWO08_3000, partial [Verrucomicrobiaceae bacterium]|nr:hypothetical protein [Verrucomicrobiaceae bacterium]